MEDPALYEKGNTIQYTDSLELITKYLPLLKLQNENFDEFENTALDIGCGTGTVTWEILRLLLPKNIKLLGADREPKMIQFACSKYPQLETFILNIETKNIPEHLYQKFNYVFSFYTFHWIRDMRQAMQNIFDMLKPKGQFFSHYLVSHVFCNPFYTLSTMEKWKDYMPSTKIVTNYYDFEDDQVITIMSKILTDIGFKISICEVESRNAIAKDIEELKDILKPIIVGYSQMPENLQEDVLKHTIELIFQQEIWRKANQNTCNKYLIPYRLIIILATKPL